MNELARTHFNLEIPVEAAAHFETYAALMTEWNERINLTNITKLEDIRIKHFLDALSVLTLPNLPTKAMVLDMGTGAGVPGLPLKIACPDWSVTLMDATRKKIDFLNLVIETLMLSDIQAVQMRAEEAGQDVHHRETYDLVLARSVARMPTLAEYLLPLCKMGGLCIAMKGETANTELNDAKFALQTLGGELESVHEVHLPNVEHTHYLACIRKVRRTPRKYPRRTGLPSKTPLTSHLKPISNANSNQAEGGKQDAVGGENI